MTPESQRRHNGVRITGTTQRRQNHKDDTTAPESLQRHNGARITGTTQRRRIMLIVSDNDG